MRINYNVSALVAKNALNNNDTRLSNSTLRLSSGYKINSAKDDAAGLAIARKMNMQIKSLQRANDNSNDGISVVNTADGAMSEIHSILQRMNELAVQSANGTNAEDDRAQIQLEIDQLIEEVDRIADTTQFNAQNLLDGTFSYKAYTNSESVKVMSYSDDVEKGMYIIKSLTYYKYTDEKITYADGTTETKKYDRYGTESADDIKEALVLDADIADTNNNYADIENVKGFPAGATVEVDDDNIIISDDKGFELKLTINDRDNVDAAGLKTDVGNTETIKVDTYTDLVALDDNGNEVTISRLVVDNATINETIPAGTPVNNITTLPDNINTYVTQNATNIGDQIDNTGIAATTTIPAGTTITSDPIPAGTTVTNVYSDAKAGDYTSLEASLGISGITNVELNGKTLEVTDSQGNTHNYKIQYSMDDYLYTSSESTRTKYSVVGNNSSDEYIQIDVTKMGPMLVQTGANEGQQLAIEIPAVNTVNLGIDQLDLTTQRSATESINIIADAINQVSTIRAKIGAYSNRLEYTVKNLDTAEENMTSSYSRIMDVDIAEETTEYTNVQILVQAATSVLAQANERPQQVLQLLQ